MEQGNDGIDWNGPIQQRCGGRAICLEVLSESSFEEERVIVGVMNENGNWHVQSRCIDGRYWNEKGKYTPIDIIQSETPIPPLPDDVAGAVEDDKLQAALSEIKDGPHTDGKMRAGFYTGTLDWDSFKKSAQIIATAMESSLLQIQQLESKKPDFYIDELFIKLGSEWQIERVSFKQTAEGFERYTIRIFDKKTHNNHCEAHGPTFEQAFLSAIRRRDMSFPLHPSAMGAA